MQISYVHGGILIAFTGLLLHNGDEHDNVTFVVLRMIRLWPGELQVA